MSFDLTEEGLPYFRTRYDRYLCNDGNFHDQIRGRAEFRMPNPDDPSESIFSLPESFMFDSGAELSAVSEEFAIAHGFGNFREIGRPTLARSFDDNLPLRPAWTVRRWVRFRDYESRLDADAGEVGGIHDFEFRIDITVVEGAGIEVPILGLIDSHALFTLGSEEDEYWFILRWNEDDRPMHPDRIRWLP